MGAIMGKMACDPLCCSGLLAMASCATTAKKDKYRPVDELRFMTFNILAPCWVNPCFYAGIQPDLLDGASREAKIFDVIGQCRADVVCLQEVQGPQVERLRADFGQDFDVTDLAENCPTSASVPNGVVVMTRKGRMSVLTASPIVWNTEGSATYVLYGTYQPHGRTLVVINSHVAWGAQGSDQVERTVDHLRTNFGWPHADLDVVWCGDFNATPEDAMIQGLHEFGFSDAFDFRSDFHTFHAVTIPSKRIDYIFFSGQLRLCHTQMPGPELGPMAYVDQLERCCRSLKAFASDHIPLVAAFS